MDRIIGPPLDARDAQGALKVGVATAFPQTGTIVTEGAIHAPQQMLYVKLLSEERQSRGQPALTEEEGFAVMETAVDLRQDERGILIRPNPARMDLAIAADELLQEYVPKRTIKFLGRSDKRLRGALKSRGENWRVYLPPTALDQIVSTIEASRSAIACGRIYYYSPANGSRLLTFAEFSRLAALTDEELQKHLVEIATFNEQFNHLGSPEVEFFETGNRFSISAEELEAIRQSPQSARGKYVELRERFRAAVADAFADDNMKDPEWLERMFSCLTSSASDPAVESEAMGLDPELSMRVEWLPGCRIDNGELILDSTLDEVIAPERRPHVPAMVRGLIFNIFQEFGQRLEYVNIGSVLPSRSYKPERGGRREVYIAQIKDRSASSEMLQIIRMQKWGVAIRLESGDQIDTAMLQAEEYTEYILDRLLACRQLGMNVPIRLRPRKVGEYFSHPNARFRGRIWTPYFVRDYIKGLATDQIPARKFRDRAFSIAFARLMGEAAASNMILGRAELAGATNLAVGGAIVFDVGDELLVEDEAGMPAEIAVTDHVGTFVDWRGSLTARAAEYAAPINRRIGDVPDPAAFADAYVAGLQNRFVRTQEDYAKHRRAFDALFNHRPEGDAGLACRWRSLLERLRSTDAAALCQLIRQQIVIPKP
jgi:hypothetical protein